MVLRIPYILPLQGDQSPRSWHAESGLPDGTDFLSDHRLHLPKAMMHTGKMNTDLMCPPGLQLTLHIGIITKSFQYPVMRHRFLSVLIINGHFFRSTGWRPIGALIVPSSSFKFPYTIARYLLVMECTFSCSAIERWAMSFLHTRREPVVSRSIRWTIPGRRTPLIPERLFPQ